VVLIDVVFSRGNRRWERWAEPYPQSSWALTSLGAMSQRAHEQGVTDTEIRIGNLMPYTGNLEAFGAIGKAEAAYFDMINAQGGINRRKVRFITHDNNSDPSIALDLTRGLVERDRVL
jgi:branched-chain amino acid transport system substrate-binding protein